MINNKVIIVMPAFNAGKTLGKTISKIPSGIADEIIIVNDGSHDDTKIIAEELGLTVINHDKNKGYGAALKTGFDKALDLNAGIVAVLHSDNQYSPELLSAMTKIIMKGEADVVLASRMMDKNVFRSMPFYRYFANRILTLMQNLVFRKKLKEYQTGYRAYKSDVLRNISYHRNSDYFVFDNQLFAQIADKKLTVMEIPCPAIYNAETSSINISGSFKYFFNVMSVSMGYLLHKLKIRKYNILEQ
ncbi:MAG: glycosyltransferase family 2 protein [Candidatus Humimicrobiaceae bacterium]